MEQSIIIPVSLDDLKQIVSEAVTRAFTGSLDRFIPEEKKYLTRKEVAQKFHVSLSTVHAWINSGKIRAVKIGRRTLFDLSEVDNAASPKYKRLQYS
ncbi:helix-turn-helix domain-containing protein [Gabonibacter massiliensis]|uniref:helix-turn-helix domain-containing protein n=1 Tax=Gabonibacter massiliensis TaxID=1720195 RepID=UPI00073F44F3|nr:helix-turn-helix domain-containing protein [Gabonibacter massiliensis]